MVRWGDYIKRTAVRRVIWIVVGLAVYALVGLLAEARAQQTPSYAYCMDTGYDPAWCANQDDALAGATARAELIRDGWTNPMYPARLCAPVYSEVSNNPVYGLFVRVTVDVVREGLEECGVSRMDRARRDWLIGQQCQGDEIWRADLGRCFGDDECKNRNDNLIRGNSVHTFSSNVCIDGCSFGPKLPTSCSSIIGEPGQLCAASYEYTGAQCYADPPDDPPTPEDPPKERCVRPEGYDFSFCKKDDGRECYTIQGGSRAGQQVCWNPGETGRKVAGDTAQTRAPGSNEPPPPDPPPGESFEKVGESMTTETTNTSEGGTSTSITTTRQDRTMYGTDAGGPGARDDSEPSGEGSDGDDDDDGDISGGSDCSAPPVCTGDRLMCGLNEGLWRIRCDGSGDSATLIGDTITDIDGAIAEGEGDGDPDDTDMLEHADPDTWREIEQVNADDLDDTGFGLDRSCPVLPAVQVGPANMQFDLTPICTFLSWMSGLVLALAYFIAARIIAGVK